MVENGRAITRRERSGPRFLRRMRDQLPIYAARERTLQEFYEIGGNTSFESADVICLGETHIRAHEVVIGEFIRAHARKGDIVLVEGAQATQRIEATGTKQETYNFPKGVDVFGWDDIDFNRVGWAIAKDKQLFVNLVRKLLAEGDREKAGKVIEILKDYSNKLSDVPDTVNEVRNSSLITTLGEARRGRPNNRVFIIAGGRHFTEDQSVKDGLEQYSHIVLAPKFQLSLEEKIGATRARLS